MNKKKSKKLYYRRAKWDNQSTDNLESLLRETHNGLQTSGERTFAYASGEIKANIEDANDKMLFHIASYIPGEPTSIINKDKSVRNASISPQSAPSGNDFLDGDIFVLVKGNHVILCPSGARESVARSYFISVLQKFQKKEANSLQLCKIANANVIKIIKNEGVKELKLNSSLYEASLLQLNSDSEKVSSLKAIIATQCERIFAKDPDLNGISDLENLDIELKIKFDGNEARKKHSSPIFGVPGKERLLRMSEKILTEFEDEKEDGFTIITGTGNRITADELRVSESCDIETYGKSLSCSDAWEKLSNYFDRLKQNGTLSQ